MRLQEACTHANDCRLVCRQKIYFSHEKFTQRDELYDKDPITKVGCASSNCACHALPVVCGVVNPEEGCITVLYNAHAHTRHWLVRLRLITRRSPTQHCLSALSLPFDTMDAVTTLRGAAKRGFIILFSFSCSCVAEPGLVAT